MSRNNKNKKNRRVAQTAAAAATITSLVASIAAIGVLPSSVIAQQFQEEDHRCPVGFTLNHGTCETEPLITCPDPLEVSENRCIMYDHEDTTAPGCLGGSLETGQGGETACADLDEEPTKYRAKFCPQGYRFFDNICTRFRTTDEPPQLVCPKGSTPNTETKTCQSIQPP
jgi:hypothetical protein